MKRAYEKIIHLDYEYARKEDIESKIWKNCIYNIIDNYRKKIKQLLKRVRRPDVDLTQDQSAFLANKELDNLSNEFRRFLESSIGFYSMLLRKFALTHNISLVKPIHSSIEQGTVEYFKYLTCYQILIYTGDLSRYHKDIPDSNEWRVSSTYYKKAQLLLPHIGTSYNQNSILSIYNKNDIQALYYSYRSICVTQPFRSANENIGLFLDKVSKKGNTEGNVKLIPQQFYSCFILMHAYLHKNDQKQYIQSTTSFTPTFFSLLNELRNNFKEYEDISNILFYCFVINIAVLHLYQDESANLDKEIYKKHLSISMDMYKYVIKEYLQCYHKNKDAAVKLFIPSIYIFTLWISSLDNKLEKIEKKVGKSRMNDLKHYFRNLMNSFSDFHINDSMLNIVLPEELELYGFIPLNDQLKSEIISNKKIFLTNEENCMEERLMKMKNALTKTSLLDSLPTKRHMIPVQILNPLNTVLKDLQGFESDSEEETEENDNKYDKSLGTNNKDQSENLISQKYLSDISISMPPHLLNEQEDSNVDPLNPTSIWSGMNITKNT